MTTVERRTRSAGPLWIVLVLVIGAFGLLVAALVTSRTSWAWGSVAASGVAAGLLVADWVAARRRPGASRGVTDRGEPVGRPTRAGGDDEPQLSHDEPGDGTDADDGVGDDADPLSASSPGATADGDPADARAAAADHVGRDDRGDRDREPPVPEPHVEPAEEPTDAADAIATADLDAIVRVIDERPRYHLPSCRWAGDRATIDIELAEARELGFTPCAVCRPDSTLAARARRR